uniref:Uncharacterized protein n=1 Tax=Nelumbo nucifera TaxID=4432 RepID=A0A822ZZZ1_NELNU|nr:TPA_asm: hypothetical protein HUJ06_018596 [Nelumbo nucifera]
MVLVKLFSLASVRIGASLPCYSKFCAKLKVLALARTISFDELL